MPPGMPDMRGLPIPPGLLPHPHLPVAPHSAPKYQRKSRFDPSDDVKSTRSKVPPPMPPHHQKQKPVEPVVPNNSSRNRNLSGSSKLTLAQLSASLGLSKALKDTDLELKSQRPPTGLPNINLSLTNPMKKSVSSTTQQHNKTAPVATVPLMQNNKSREVKTHHSPPASPTDKPKKSIYQMDSEDEESNMSPQTPPGRPPPQNDHFNQRNFKNHHHPHDIAHEPRDETAVEDMFAQVEKEMSGVPNGGQQVHLNGHHLNGQTNGVLNSQTNDSDTSFSSLSDGDFNIDDDFGKPQLESTLQSHKRETGHKTRERSRSGGKSGKSGKKGPVDTKCEATCKEFLKPYFQERKITKEQYKACMKRIVMRYMKKPQSFSRRDCEKVVVFFVGKYVAHNQKSGHKIKHKSRSGDPKKKSRSSSKNRKHQAGHLKVKSTKSENPKIQDQKTSNTATTRIGNRQDMYALLSSKNRSKSGDRRQNNPPPPPPPDDLSDSDVTF